MDREKIDVEWKVVVPISSDDITVLWAAEAELHGNLVSPADSDETQGERPHLWVEGWHSLPTA